MVNLPTQILIAARPIHWIKNLALFAALVFTATFFIESYFLTVFWAFIVFNFATSAAYIFNDIVDAKRDSLHPIKKNRPIASGKLSKPVALFTALILASISLLLASQLGSLFLLMTIIYLLIQVAYSLFLKNIAIVDIITIAVGFVLRVYAGAVVINAHLSVWFLLCVISVALFLAAGKRRSELSVISGSAGATRKSLTRYKKELLNSYVTMFGNAAWLSWALFTFFESPPADFKVWLFLAEISKATTISKLLMATIPVVIFIIMRYESIIFTDKSEAPEKVFLTDKPLVISVLVYLGMVMAILYGGIANV